jgi:transcriptional antiterminator RfaH
MAHYVVQTNPQREHFVIDHLKALQPYCPLFKNPRGKVRPLFPSYVFITAIADWSPIQNCFGVKTILMACTGRPAQLADSVIALWRSKERNGLVELPQPPKFRAGQRLIITRGSLKNRSVIYVGQSAKEREAVLIDMLGQHVKITVPSDDLVGEQEERTRISLQRRREEIIRQVSYRQRLARLHRS